MYGHDIQRHIDRTQWKWSESKPNNLFDMRELRFEFEGIFSGARTSIVLFRAYTAKQAR